MKTQQTGPAFYSSGLSQSVIPDCLHYICYSGAIMQSMYILPPPKPVKLIHCALECSVKCLASAQAGLIYLMCWGQQIFTPAPCRRCGCLRQLRLRRCLLALRSWHLRTLDTELQIVFLSLSQTLLIFLTILLQFINDNEDVNFLQIK